MDRTLVDVDTVTALRVPHSGLTAAELPPFDTKHLMDEHFAQWAEQYRDELDVHRPVQDLVDAKVVQLMSAESDQATELKRLVAQTHPADLSLAEKGEALWVDAGVAGLLDDHGAGDITFSGGNTMTMTAARDRTYSIHKEPYADQWTNTSGRHQQLVAQANKNSGLLQVVYTIGQEGGAAFAGAGVCTFFRREVPGYPSGEGPAGLAHVSTYTPYQLRWRNKSYLGTAHQRGGFGVKVWSQNYNGSELRVEQDHTYRSWDDATSWYDDHHNLNLPGFNHTYALNGPNAAPYFAIEPHRWYQAWIWCFISGDAHGADIFSAAYANAQIVASVDAITIGQT